MYRYAIYFELIGQRIDHYKLTPARIYNMDEKGFMLGVGSQEKIVLSAKLLTRKL